MFGYPAGLPQVFAAGGMRRFVTQKLSWNKHEPVPPLARSGGRASTARGCSPTSRRSTRTTPRSRRPSCADSVAQLPRARLERLVADAVRLRRRRRRADARDARAGRAGSPTSTACRASSSARRREFFDARRGRGRRRRAGAGVARRAVLRDAPRHADQPAAHQARQPALRAAAARGRAVGGDGRRRSTPHELDELWQEVLTQQFHDILPGSSIAWVHADAEAVHARVAAELEERIAGALGDARRRRAASLANVADASSATRSSSSTVDAGRRRARRSARRRADARSAPACPGSALAPAVGASTSTTASSSPTAR